MGLPVTVYRWDDVGAPQLSVTPTPNEIIDVLKACLVNGYGTKVPLGWSIAFEDVPTSKIAFRNSTTEGSGGFIQYSSSDGTNAEGRQMYIKAASAMSALDSFTHPSYQFVHNNSWTANQWVIVGTSAGFYFIPRYSYQSYNLNYLNSSQSEVTYFVGDLDSNYINDVTRFTICAHNFTNNMTNVNYSHAIGYGGVSGSGIMYGVDGSNTSNAHVIDCGSLNFQMNNSNYTLELSGINPVLTPVCIRMSSTNSTDVDGVKCIYSNKSPFYRGLVAGLYAMPFCGYGNAKWPIIRNWNGQDYMLLRNYHTGTWVNITEWY
jgi:hypothetical protein